MRIEAAGMAMAAVRAAENTQGRENRENNALPEKSAKHMGQDIYQPYEEESAGIYEVGFEGGRRVVGVNPFNGENPPKKDGEKDSEAEGEKPRANGDSSPKAGGGEKSPKSEKEKSESCTCNTDKVDREIKALKEKIKKIKQQAEKAEGDERERLSKQLSALEAELAQKDCDSYRRQHSEFR
ncbi:MAG: hypothetical protein K2K57_12705 [Oscillospiraceae bacterium]|nr:hypothetical protein [Oscillospiraceae bacterium]